MPATYHPVLVVMSVLVAMFASFVALTMVARLTSVDGALRRRWLMGSAFAMGTGIWSMHFVGMLALGLPVAIGYYIPWTLLSIVIAITGSFLALWLTRPDRIAPAVWIAGGVSVGGGIAGLHYLDMAAMRMAAHTRYAAPLVALSIAIGVGFGFLSLWLARRYRIDQPAPGRRGKVLSAIVMGIAIAGLHYTAMAAATFTPAPAPPYSSWVLHEVDLPQVVIASTLLILGTALVGAGRDRQAVRRALLSRRLLEARDAERRSIAKRMHEDLGQILTAIRLDLQRIEATTGSAASAEVADSLQLVDVALQRVRDLSVELRPAVLDDLGLGPAVRWLAERQARRAGYNVTVEDRFERRASPTVEAAAFRVVREALTNIARHARATNVLVTLERVPVGLEVCISDNGVGFRVPEARRGAEAGRSIGVLDMEETAAHAGGSLSIVAAPGDGTTVRAVFPVDGT